MSNLHKLHGLGQSVWLDFIRRSHTRSGELARLVAAGVRGVTSNPTIFDKAISGGGEYDLQIAVESFAQSFTSLLVSLEQKRRSLGV